MRAAADPERVVIAEMNPNAPRTLGLLPDHPHRIHVDQVDALVESDRPMYTLPDDEPNEIDVAIAGHARPFITDGSTLQTGIGGIPSTIARMLATEDGGDYGVHSEMFTTGLMHLHKAGKVTNARKNQYQGMSITTFALGTPELNEFLDGNDEVRFLPADVVNAPQIIAHNHHMVTINGALTVDLWGQAVADTIGGRQFSGIGGHEDFVSVAGFGLEDRALLCLPSTAVVGGQRISRIAAELAAGAVVTTPRHQLDLVVTEYGVASLRGRTVRERAAGAGRDRPPRLPRRAVGPGRTSWVRRPRRVDGQHDRLGDRCATCVVRDHHRVLIGPARGAASSRECLRRGSPGTELALDPLFAVELKPGPLTSTTLIGTSASADQVRFGAPGTVVSQYGTAMWAPCAA